MLNAEFLIEPILKQRHSFQVEFEGSPIRGIYPAVEIYPPRIRALNAYGSVPFGEGKSGLRYSRP